MTKFSQTSSPSESESEVNSFFSSEKDQSSPNTILLEQVEPTKKASKKRIREWFRFRSHRPKVSLSETDYLIDEIFETYLKPDSEGALLDSLTQREPLVQNILSRKAPRPYSGETGHSSRNPFRTLKNWTHKRVPDQEPCLNDPECHYTWTSRWLARYESATIKSRRTYDENEYDTEIFYVSTKDHDYREKHPKSINFDTHSPPRRRLSTYGFL